MKNKVIALALALLTFCSTAVLVFASGGPDTSSGTATVTNTTGTGSSYSFGYVYDSTYYGSLSSERQNVSTSGARASVAFSSNVFTISATSSAGENPWGSWGDKSAQNVSTEVTITNNSTSTLKIGYTYSVTEGTIEGSDLAVGSGTLTWLPGESIFLMAKTQVTNWTAESSTATATFQITSCEEESSFDLTIYPSQFGSYSYSVGEDITGTLSSESDAYTMEASSSDTVTLAVPQINATYADEYYFYGWSVNGVVTASSAAYTGAITTHTIIFPVFVKNGTVDSSGNGPFYVNGNYYVFWREAFLAAGTSYPVVVARDYTLPATLQENGLAEADGKYVNGNASGAEYIVPAGSTLLIPYDDANTVVTTSPSVVTSYSTTTAPTAYRTMTIAGGTKLILNGSLSIGGTLVASQTYGYNGLPTGKLGHIKMEEGSSIEANSGSFIYAIGYIHGNGSVTVNSGATVYECFQIRDFRGGTATSRMKTSKKTFPLSQYYVQNIEVPMTVNAGAVVNGLSAFNINDDFQIPVIPFIGKTDDYLFKITDGNIVKDYIEGTDRLYVNINGSLSVRPFTFSLPGLFGMASIDTNDFTLPISHNITVEVSNGKTLTVNQDISLLPGTELLINDGANCVLGSGKKIIVYDSSNWGNYCGEKHHSTGDDVPVKPLIFVANGAPKTNRFTTDATTLADAAVKINGTMDASGGSLYVTDGGANIYSTACGELKLGTPPAQSTDSQAMQNDSSISYTEIAIYAAKLRHGDGSYLPTGDENYGAGTYRYHPEHKRWVLGEHSFDEGVVTTTPTCTTPGVKTYTCACGYSYTQSVAPIAHTDNNSDEKCDTCGAAMSGLIESFMTQIVLGNALDMRIAFNMGDHTPEDTYVIATKVFADGRENVSKTIPSSQWVGATINGSQYYYFTFDDISAKEMTDNIYVTVYNASNVPISNGYTESIQSYITRYLTNLGENPTDEQKLARTMLADMLTYGAAAQTYYNYGTSSLATEGLGTSPTLWPENYQFTVESLKPDDTWNSRLHLSNTISLQMTFEGIASDMYAVAHHINHRGNTVTSEQIKPTTYFEINQIVVADAHQPVTVTVYNSDGSEYGRIVDSVESYAKRIFDKANSDMSETEQAEHDKLVALLQRILLFSDSAYDYLHRNDVQ